MMDPNNFEFIDFDLLYKFMVQYDKDILRPLVNAILGRENVNEDFKIDFNKLME